MKVLKIVLSVLTLILALLIAAASFFLYEKRELMLAGWSKLAAAIHFTAAELDKNSGTKLSEELTEDSLSHANYANLDEALPKINAAAGTVVAQRDSMASAIREIGLTQEMSNVPAAKEYTELVTSKGSVDATVANAKAFKRNRDQVYGSMDAIARQSGSSVDVSRLRNGDVSGLNNFKTKLQQDATRSKEYQDSLQSIGRIVGTPVSDFSQNGYRSSIVKVRDGVNTMNSNLNAANQKIRQQDSTIRNLNSQVKDRDNRIAAQSATIRNREVRIQELNKVIGISSDSEAVLWVAGSPESRKDIRGKVTEVNNEFGFFVIDFGKNTRARQVIGKKINYVDPQLAKDMKIMVVRNADSEGKVEYIRRGKLTEVMDSCSVADPTEKGAAIEVGDVVYLDLASK